jgi:uncharacterized protein
MGHLVDFVSNYLFIAAVSAWITSVILKWVINKIRGERPLFAQAFQNGGMPSSHSSLVASLAMGIYIVEGLSAAFYLAVMIAIIVMSDAFRVRKNLGLQGDSINKLLARLKQNPIEVVHGHSALQVIIGALWGILVAILVFGIMV